MHTHGPSCLEGPLSSVRGWWARPAARELNSNDQHSAFGHGPVPKEDPPVDRGDPDLRSDLVERIRREIAAGTYETPEKWEVALDRFLDSLGHD